MNEADWLLEHSYRMMLEEQLTRAKEIIHELLGHLELVSIIPESGIDKVYVPKTDADFMERAREFLRMCE